MNSWQGKRWVSILVGEGQELGEVFWITFVLGQENSKYYLIGSGKLMEVVREGCVMVFFTLIDKRMGRCISILILS